MQFAATFTLPVGTPMRIPPAALWRGCFVAGLCGLADVIEAFRSHGVDSDMM
jgi:hypothetical protein